MSVYDDGLPDGAFTDLERESGVPGLLRGGGTVDRQAFRPFQSTVSVDELIEHLVGCICAPAEERVDVDVVPRVEEQGEDYGLDSLHRLGPTDDRRHFFYLTRRYRERISVDTLIAALERSRLPLISMYDESDWVVWNPETRRLMANVQKGRYSPPDDEFHRDFPSGKPEQDRACALLRRSWLTTDHGHKPLLLRNEFVADALRRLAVPFEVLDAVEPEDVSAYSLVFFDAAGQVQARPLEEVSSVNLPLHSRLGVYDARWGRLRPRLTCDVMFANAFRILGNHNPNEFSCFTRRRAGTVFQSAYSRVAHPSRKSEASMRPDWPQTAAKNADRLLEWAKTQGDVFIAVSGHPVEADLVTTPQLYHHAVHRVLEHGYSLSYNDVSKGVKFHKVSDIPAYRPADD
jgi:hypothetical protein